MNTKGRTWKLKRSTVKGLCRSADIVCLVECRGTPDDVRNLPGTHHFFANMFPLPPGAAFSSRRGGVVIGVRRTLLARLESCGHEVICKGRASGITMSIAAGERLGIVAVHIDASLSAAAQRLFLQRVLRVEASDPQLPRFLVGDWNSVSDADEGIRDDCIGRLGGDKLASTFDEPALLEPRPRCGSRFWQRLVVAGRRTALLHLHLVCRGCGKAEMARLETFGVHAGCGLKKRC